MPASVLYPLLCLLLFLSAFFSGSETALFTLSRVQIKMLGEKGGRTGAKIAKLLSNPRRVLNTLLLCNLLVNTVLSAVLSKVLLDLCGPAGLGYAVLASTVLLLIFGEITPKVIGLSQYMFIAKVAVWVLDPLCSLASPFRAVLRVVSNLVLRSLGLPLEKVDRLTKDTYYAALMTGKSQGALKMNEADVIHSICAYRSMTAADVRVARTDMAALRDDLTLFQAMQAADRFKVLNLPVCHGNEDHVVGVLNLARVTENWREIRKDSRLCDLMEQGVPFIEEPFFTPGTRQLDGLLKELRDRNLALAVVLDEYGGTDGVIYRTLALDAMLGGVMGMRQRPIHVRPNGDIIASASIRLVDLNWECGLNFPVNLDVTLAGYVLRATGALPEAGFSFQANGYEITILKRSGRRLESIRLRPLKEGGAQ